MSADDAGIPQLVSELWQLVIAYLKQETLGPFRRIGRFVAWGLAGSVAVAIGMASLLAGVLRLLQTATDGAFDGNLSPLPYLITLAVGAVVAALTARAVVSGRIQRERS